MKFKILKIGYSWIDKYWMMYESSKLLHVKVKMETGEILKFELSPHIKLYSPELTDVIIKTVTNKYEDFLLQKAAAKKLEEQKQLAPKPSFWKGKVFNTK